MYLARLYRTHLTSFLETEGMQESRHARSSNQAGLGSWRIIGQQHKKAEIQVHIGLTDRQKMSNGFYKLMGSRDRAVEAYGVDRYIDFNEPLIL
jgi:hypothetical protein